jgi:hypothetical protein
MRRVWRWVLGVAGPFNSHVCLRQGTAATSSASPRLFFFSFRLLEMAALRLVVACATLCLASAAYSVAPGLLPAGNDLTDLSGPMSTADAELACDASKLCMGFTFDTGTTPPYIFFKTAGGVAGDYPSWSTHLKVGFTQDLSPQVQQMEVGADGRGTGAVGDPRCGEDVTTAGGRPFSCEANAKSGECHINPGWMIMFCPNACGMCDLKVHIIIGTVT